MCANELISEPTPYGLHASMYLVGLRQSYHDQLLTRLPSRQHSETKVHQNSTNSSSNPQRITGRLDAMHRPK
jgi:hypothetical protein